MQARQKAKAKIEKGKGKEGKSYSNSNYNRRASRATLASRLAGHQNHPEVIALFDDSPLISTLVERWAGGGAGSKRFSMAISIYLTVYFESGARSLSESRSPLSSYVNSKS